MKLRSSSVSQMIIYKSFVRTDVHKTVFFSFFFLFFTNYNLELINNTSILHYSYDRSTDNVRLIDSMMVLRLRQDISQTSFQVFQVSSSLKTSLRFPCQGLNSTNDYFSHTLSFPFLSARNEVAIFSVSPRMQKCNMQNSITIKCLKENKTFIFCLPYNNTSG